MVLPSNKPLDDVIAWHFHVSEQHNQARYGVWQGKHWKQFMPSGMINTVLHPPKLISKAVYEHAKCYAE